MAEAAPISREEIAGPVAASLSDGVLTLTLANPPANALSLDMISALLGELHEAASNTSARVIVIAASGKVFCAGHDLKEITAHRNDRDRGRAFFQRVMEGCAALMKAIVRHPRPVIAKVGGMATAAGCQLVASCDLAVATENARFATPGVDIGLFCSTPMVALSRNLPRKQAMEMLLTGEAVDARTARELGLVNRVVARDELDGAVAELAATIVSKSALTLKIGKEAFYAQAEMGLSEAYDYAAKVMVDNMLARDAEEGISAFIEKRRPVWSDE